MKKLILVAAPPACGKTYVSKLLCKQLGRVAYFDKDSLAPLIHACFAAGGREVDMDGDFYRASIRSAEYKTVLALALEALELADMALVNAPFGYHLQHPEVMEESLRPFRAMGVEVVLIWLQSEPELCYRRMAERNAERDQRKLLNRETYFAGISFDPPAQLVQSGIVDLFFVLDRRIEDPNETELKRLAKKIVEA